MLLSIQGSDCPACQIAGLRAGFAALGHTHTDDWAHPDVSFVFVGNPPYIPYLTGDKKVIINVLDLARHCPEHLDIVNTLKDQAPRAARVTAISKTVAAQVGELCGIKAEVIYYPMKPVHHTGVAKYPHFKALLVGRVNDPNKRVKAAMLSLTKAGYTSAQVAVVGSENPGWGTYLGVVDDETLNDLYNSVDYVLALSKEEGILLPPCEAAVCGAIPIIAPSLSTFDEFWVQSPLALHYQQLSNTDSVSALIRALDADPKWKAEVKQDLLGYGALYFRPRFDAVEVAKRIIDTFHTI